MKIVSFSSSIAGPACAIAKSIKKHFYNNDYITNIFDYLEISLHSILEILYLKDDDINYLSLNNEIYLNKDDNNSVKFNNFDKIISHHDLKKIYTTEDYDNFIKKYIRRYHRLIYDILREDKIFFIRYGIEDENIFNKIMERILELNPNLKIYFIIINYDENNRVNNENHSNYIYINFYNYHKNIDKNTDLFVRTLNYDWKNVYNIILTYLNTSEKELFRFYE